MPEQTYHIKADIVVCVVSGDSGPQVNAANNILTEAGDDILTEAGDNLTTEN